MRRRAWASLAAAVTLLGGSSTASAQPHLLHFLHAKHVIPQLSVSADRLFWEVGLRRPIVVRADTISTGRVETIGKDDFCRRLCRVQLASTGGRAWWEVSSVGPGERNADIFTASNGDDERHVLSERGACTSATSEPVARAGIALLTVFRLVNCRNEIMGGTVYAASVASPSVVRPLAGVPAPEVLHHAGDPSQHDVVGLATAGGRLAVIPNRLGAPTPRTVTVQVRDASTGALITSFGVTGGVRWMSLTKRYVVMSVRLPTGKWAIQWYDVHTGDRAGSHPVRPGIWPVTAYGPRVVYGRGLQVRLLDLRTNRGARLWLDREEPQDVQIDGRLVAWISGFGLDIVGLRLPPA